MGVGWGRHEQFKTLFYHRLFYSFPIHEPASDSSRVGIEWRRNMGEKVLKNWHSCNLVLVLLDVADPLYDFFLQSTSPFTEDLSTTVPLALLPVLPSGSLTTSLWFHFMGCPPGKVYLKVTQWGFLPRGPYFWPMGNSSTFALPVSGHMGCD